MFTKINIVDICLGCRPEDIAPKVIISPILKITDFKKIFSNIEAEFGQKYWWSGITGIYEGERITFIYSGRGAAKVGDLTIVLKSTPCRHLLFLGSMGSLHDDLTIGDFALAGAAIDGEGFSHYYTEQLNTEALLKKKVFIDPVSHLLHLARRKLNQGEYNYRVGDVFTIGSLFAEKEDFLVQLKEAEIIGIDQETSALYTAAQVGDIEPLALYYVFDKPMETSIWDETTLEQLECQRRSLNRLPILGLEIQKSI
ncbi:MAG: hypothetical protein ABIH39_04770 [Candidatus Margulisiibacteriota bacterium]